MEAVNGVSEADKGGPPAPSPLTGCYLLVVVGEPHSKEHKDIILRRIAKGLLSWDISDCHVDLEKELAIITEQAPEGEDARYGERLIQFASENLVTEILIHPAISTLSQCMKNLLSSFTRHRHIIHAGYTFAANGSWILQDGTFSLTDFSEAFQETEVQRVLRAYDNSISLDIHCSPEGDWTRLPKESFTRNCKVRVNPDDVLTSGCPSIVNFLNYISPFLVPTDIETLLESSDVVGNIRFSHPTLYVFPGGQGDAALFGINGFNMLVDGGFARKACFWDFVRHLDRLDAVLLTRLNNSNVSGISSVLRRKRFNTVYPQIGHFFCNIQERKAILSPDGDKDKDPLIVNLLEEGQDIVSNLRQLHLQPQSCYRDIDPINLYHKVGHGTLDMYVLSPAKESKEVREFIQKWNTNDQRLFANQRNGRDFTFPTQNLVSICALLVWQPANANESITRILFPGSTPQHKIFEGLDRLKQLECIKYPSCSAKTLTPSLMKSKQAKVEKLIQQEQKENKIKTQPDTKAKVENKVAEENIKNIQTNGVTTNQVINEKIMKKHDSTESEKSGPPSAEGKKPEEGKEPTNLTNGKPAEEKVEKAKPKAKPEQKPKVEAKVYKHTRSIERKPKPTAEKKASPTTPKKTLDTKVNGDGPTKLKPATKISPSATPAKSAKEANNRKVFESKYKVAPKKEISKPDKKEPKPERKPISRRPKESSPSGKLLESPVKKLNELHKVEARKSKLEKEGTTDSSTVSTPSADADTAMKKDISKLTPEELEHLQARELAELKEEQEVVKEIEAVFRKSEHKTADDSDLRKVKNISVDDKTEGEGEEYLIIEKEEIEHDSLDEKETKESETQKHLRDSEESEKPRKLSVEVKDIKDEKPIEAPTLEEAVKVQDNEAIPTTDLKAKDEKEQPKAVSKEVSKEVSVASPDDKVDLSSGKKVTDRDVDEENKDGNVLESQPDEKFSTPIESGATTAPTLPEDERIPLDEIKEDNGDQAIEEKYVKEDTKEKEIPIVQLPPKTTEAVAKLPTVVGIRLDKQTPIRDLVKTPDEVADLPIHEEVGIENYEHYHVSSSQTPKQEELKQIIVSKESKTEKAEKGSVVKPEEKVASEEKPVDIKDEKLEETKQELTKPVEEKGVVAETKETPVKAAEVEVLPGDEKSLKSPEKDHEEEKVDLEKEKVGKVEEGEQVVLEEIKAIDKEEEKVEENKTKTQEVAKTEDVHKQEEQVIEKAELEKVEEKKTEIKEVTKTKQEEQVPDTKESEKVESRKPTEVDLTEKVIEAAVEKETSLVDFEKEKVAKEELEKGETEHHVAKGDVEKAAEADAKKVEVEEELLKSSIETLEKPAEKKDVEKIASQQQIDDIKDGDGIAAKAEVAKTDVTKAEAKEPAIDEKITEKVVDKEKVEIKESVEKPIVAKVEVAEISTIQADADKLVAKIDEENIKKGEALAEKSDLGKLEKSDVDKLPEVVAPETKHIEKVEKEQPEKEDAMQDSKIEMKESTEEQTDDVEAKIVAIEKELVAVITEDVKEIEIIEEKADAPEKDLKIDSIGKMDTEIEKSAAHAVKELKAVDDKETEQEKPASSEILADLKDIKAADSVHSALIEGKPISKTDQTELHDKEDIKQAATTSEEKHVTSTKQPAEVHEDKVTTERKVETEIKSDETKKELKEVPHEDVDEKIVDLNESELKLEADKEAEKGFDIATPHPESVKQEKDKTESVSPKEEVKEEAVISVKQDKALAEADHFEGKIKEHKLEDLSKTEQVEAPAIEGKKKEQTGEKSAEVEKDKIDLKDIDKEIVKSDAGEDSKLGKELTEAAAVTSAKEKHIVDEKLHEDKDKVADIKDKVLQTFDKVDAKETLTDEKAAEENLTIAEHKDTATRDGDEFAKEKIYHEDIILVDVAQTGSKKTEATVKVSDVKELDVQIIEPKEIKEVSEKKEPLMSESGNKPSEKGVQDIEAVEKLHQHDIKTETVGITRDDEKSDKEKSAIEQKEEDTGKFDKTSETVTAPSVVDEKLNQSGKSPEEDQEDVKSIKIKQEEKMDVEKKAIFEKEEEKKEETLPSSVKDVQNIITENELQAHKEEEKVAESKEESSVSKHAKIEDLAKYEKKEEKLFKVEEQLIKDVSSLPSEVSVIAALSEALKETTDGFIEGTKDAKELDPLPQIDKKKASDETEEKDQEKKDHEKVEDITASVNQMAAKIEEDFKTDTKGLSLAAEVKIEDTAAGIKETVRKTDSSVNEQEHETDSKVSKSDVTILPKDDKSALEGSIEKQLEPKRTSISIEKSDKTPLLETSKTEEKTVQQGEKDYAGETDEKTVIKSCQEDSVEINKIDQKLQELKYTINVEDKIEPSDFDQEQSVKSESRSKNGIAVVDKLELGRKSPKEREQDVATIVASVAEVLKSDAPLEEFDGKIPLEITTFGPYELRETHITTVESPIREEIIGDKIQMHPIEEEKSSPRDPVSTFLEEERKIAPVHTNYDDVQKGESKVSSLLKDSTELMQATSKIISDIKQSVKVDDDVVPQKIIETDTEKIAEKVTAGEILTENKAPVLEKPSSVPDDSSPKTLDIKEELLDTKKDSLDNTLCDIAADSSLPTVKLTADSKESIQDALEVEKLQTSSGKSSPETKEPPEETIDIKKSPITSGKTTPDLKEDLISGKAAPDVKDNEISISGKTIAGVLEPVKKSDLDISKPTSLSGKSSPDIKELVVDLIPTGKETPESKDREVIDKDVILSGKATPETKEHSKDLGKIVEDSSKVSSDTKEVPSGKRTPDIKEPTIELATTLVEPVKTTDIKETAKSSSEATPIVSEFKTDIPKSTTDSATVSSDAKDTVKSSLDTTPITSGKTTPEIKEPITNISKSIIDSEKVTSDAKDSLDTTPVTSDKTTPDIKEPATDLSKSIIDSEKITTDVTATVKSSLDKTPVSSTKTTSEITEPVSLSKSVTDSEKVTSEVKKVDTTPLSSEEAKPEISEVVSEMPKTLIGSQKEGSEIKELTKSSLDASPVASGKTSPEVKEIAAELPKTSVDPQKLVSEIKEAAKSSLDTSPVISGKTTPEIKEPTDVKDAISSGKTTPDFVDKSKVDSKKSVPEETIKDELATCQSSIISPEIIEPVKDTLTTGKSPFPSGRSTPDIVIHEDNSPIVSGYSTPDIEEPADKHLDDLEKCSATKIDSATSPKPSDEKQPTTQIESDKKIVESGKHTSEAKVQSEIPPVVQSTADEHVIDPPLATTTASIDANKPTEAARKLSLDKSKSPVASGKSTPDLQHSTKNGIDQVKSAADSRKSSLLEHSDIDRTSSASGTSTPEVKDPVSVISGKITPDTKVPSVQPGVSASKTKTASGVSGSEIKDHQTISAQAKIESVPGPSSSSKDGRVSPSKSPSEELEYSRKSTPDIADVTKSKDLDESVTGRTTPPTVPVSPIVKEKQPLVHEQDFSRKDVPEVFILKATDARSSTPASDDCDISSGQVSRVLTAEEDDEKQGYSDDEDLPGSPMSATSQVAHSTSSQYDFEDSVRGVGTMDPMSTSFYGALPDDPVDLSKRAKTGRFLDEADLDFDRALHEHRQTRGEDLTSGSSPSHVYEITTAKYSSIKLQEEAQAPSAPITLQKESLMTASFIGSELPTDSKDDPIASWGKPLGLPSPAPLNDNKGTPKKERRIPPNVMAKNKLNEDKKLSDSKYDRRGKKITPVYVDLTYVPHHGNSNYSYVDFFKRVRARYYVFSGIEPSKEVYSALLEAKQTWDDKELEVTIIPTYDTDVLGYWVAENEDLLAKYKIDLSPSASRCTINLQDHETSCSAYRLEFS